MKRLWKMGAAAVLVGAATWGVEHGLRCYGAPWERDEALRRAREALGYLSEDYSVEKGAALIDEKYDRELHSWSFLFRSNSCDVSVFADRCNGTDIGGMSRGCPSRRGEGYPGRR